MANKKIAVAAKTLITFKKNEREREAKKGLFIN